MDRNRHDVEILIPEILEILEALCKHLGVEYDFEKGSIVEVVEGDNGLLEYGIPINKSVAGGI